jgi:hypothetical protein
MQSFEGPEVSVRGLECQGAQKSLVIKEKYKKWPIYAG